MGSAALQLDFLCNNPVRYIRKAEARDTDETKADRSRAKEINPKV
jgi:hypothetical protein